MGLLVGVLAYPFSTPLPLPQFLGVFILGGATYVALLIVFRAVTMEEIKSVMLQR